MSDRVERYQKYKLKIIDKYVTDMDYRRVNIMTCNNNCDHEYVEVKQLILDDGRKAERRVSHDEAGNEVVEIFAEERRPLKIEKRIIREHKNVIAKETHETIRDGEISHVEVRSLEPNVPLQIRERIGLADHHKIVDGDYVRKDEIGKIVADSVVAGISALMENMEPVPNNKMMFSAQSVVEQNVAEKNNNLVNVIMITILVAQLAFFGYMFLV